jgi:hypothetical protein
MSRGRGGRFIEVTPPVFSGTGRRGRSNLPITTGTRVCRDGCRSPGCLWFSVFPGSDIARRPVRSLRRSQVRRGLPLSPSLRFLRLGLIRLQHLRPRPRLRLFRPLLRVLIRLRILPRPSPFRTRPPSAICHRVRLIPRTVVHTVTQRRLRLRVPSIWRVRVTLRAAGLLMDGVAGRLRVLGIAHVRLVQDSPPRWPHRMRWVVVSPAY